MKIEIHVVYILYNLIKPIYGTRYMYFEYTQYYRQLNLASPVDVSNFLPIILI